MDYRRLSTYQQDHASTYIITQRADPCQYSCKCPTVRWLRSATNVRSYDFLVDPASSFDGTIAFPPWVSVDRHILKRRCSTDWSYGSLGTVEWIALLTYGVRERGSGDDLCTSQSIRLATEAVHVLRIGV